MEDPYEPEPPFEYECFACESRFHPRELDDYDPGDEMIECPECGAELRNVTTPSRE